MRCAVRGYSLHPRASFLCKLWRAPPYLWSSGLLGPASCNLGGPRGLLPNPTPPFPRAQEPGLKATAINQDYRAGDIDSPGAVTIGWSSSATPTVLSAATNYISGRLWAVTAPNGTDASVLAPTVLTQLYSASSADSPPVPTTTYWPAAAGNFTLDAKLVAMLEGVCYDHYVIELNVGTLNASSHFVPTAGGRFYSQPFSWCGGYLDYPFIDITSPTSFSTPPVTSLSPMAGAATMQINWTASSVPWTQTFRVSFMGFTFLGAEIGLANAPIVLAATVNNATIVGFNGNQDATGTLFSVTVPIPASLAGMYLYPVVTAVLSPSVVPCWTPASTLPYSELGVTLCDGDGGLDNSGYGDEFFTVTDPASASVRINQILTPVYGTSFTPGSSSSKLTLTYTSAGLLPDDIMCVGHACAAPQPAHCPPYPTHTRTRARARTPLQVPEPGESRLWRRVRVVRVRAGHLLEPRARNVRPLPILERSGFCAPVQ